MAPAPAFDAVRAAHRASEATLLDRHGVPLQTLRIDHAARRLDWVTLDAVSPRFVRTLLAAEDRRFRMHPGVDPIAVVSAALDNLRRDRARGASTITMQLATLVARGDGSDLSAWRAKLRQVRTALAIEARWSKDEILEAYLNLAPFRGELQGIGAAAQGLFGKAPSGLDATESALLVAMLPSPAAGTTRLARRACAVAARVVATSQVECDRIAFLAAALPRRPDVPLLHDEAPHLARRLLVEAGTTVRSTLDATIQRHAREALREQLRSLASHHVEDGAIVVLENATGDVLAYVGSSGELSSAPQVDGVRALRQPGSTLKPFLYALAIEARWLTAGSVLEDTPLAITTPVGLYLPQNYDRDFRGAVTLRTALAGSLNVPAVRTLTLIGLPRFHERLRALGFASLTGAAEHYGYGLALGGADVDLLTLANAYRTLANRGRSGPVRFRADDPAVPPDATVLDARAAFIVEDILADRGARAGTFGTASPLDTQVRAAVKTGTSKAMRDNWALGWTDRFTVGVWVGNFSGSPMLDVSGVTGAAPILRTLIDRLHADLPPTGTAVAGPPEGVVRVVTRFPGTPEPPRAEWYLAGTEMTEVNIVARQVLPRIVAPAQGTIVAVDPDVPPGRQTLRLEARAAAGACFELDGVRIAGACGASGHLLPLPGPGAHTVSLRAADGRLLDRVGFEVRGIPRAGILTAQRN
jgi:penicillin-binding protein 1C